ncbi:AAA family ATPase [Pyxidicoccus fallax]|uniref:AAA family ATPase n=1 Tax=Pyxidicoccus fallax TaxID=394095 RepID=A0A848LT09_9BACT|nr:AAA family ATPase [Pyxidicoccus fallax]NMO20906.1 AAA family ATPase [Pyxidicoccus fallax]NPC81918.1 AAA family ATPase [Pyxidicoccus fallax]
MKLTRLVVHHYRHVTPGTELVFSPTLNLVLGENGTGRTTLLELISTVVGSDFSGLIHEAFALEYDLAFPGMKLHVYVRNEQTSANAPEEPPRRGAELLPLRTPAVEGLGLHPRIEVDLRLTSPSTHMVMRADNAGLDCKVDGEQVWSRAMSWSLLDRSVWTLLFMTAQYIDRDMKERLKDLLRRTFLLAPQRFDEALGMFERMGHIRYAMEARDGEVFPLGLMALPTWMPGWLREQVEREAPPDVLELRHDALERSFLARFVALAGFTAGTFRVEVQEKRSFENGGRVGFGGFGFHFTRPDGRGLSHAELGFGQKRLLSFLYYLDVNEDFAITDELANGLHPRWVEACMRELGTRQVFLTSQNPLPLEHTLFSSAEELRASLLLCREGAWANPTREAAGRLFDAYRLGARPLAVLLREQGLW